jgi:hypothetical protein
MATKKTGCAVSKARAERAQKDSVDLTNQQVVERAGARALATELKVKAGDVEKAMERLAPDGRLAVIRRAAIRASNGSLGIESLPVNCTPEEYARAVTFRFVDMVVWTASEPLSLRSELRRYIQVLENLRKELPKRKRQPGDDVQMVLDVLARGGSIYEAFPKAITKKYYGKNYSEMNATEMRAARKKLKKRVSALESTRKSRGSGKVGNTSPK